MGERRSTAGAAVIAVGVGALTIGMSLAALPAALWSRDRGVPWIARRWARWALACARVRVRVEGLDPATLTPPYVVMANHTSHFDVVSLYAVLPIAVRFVAKRELQYVPVFGQVLAMGAAIMIDRGNKARAIASIERAGRAIRRGASVVLFPEGTRTPPGTLGPLKKGPFHLAVEAAVPVLPVGIVGTGAILARGDWRIQPGEVVVRIGAPIAPIAPARAAASIEGSPVPRGDATAAEADAEAARAALAAEVERALATLAELRVDPA